MEEDVESKKEGEGERQRRGRDRVGDIQSTAEGVNSL